MKTKIQAVIDRELEEIFEECYPKWITSLWTWVAYYKHRFGFTFEENKEGFFYLIERLLKEGKVRFGEEGEWIWGADADAVVTHLKAGWPTTVTEEGSLELVDYFYDLDRCPPVSWLGEDGEWRGS